MAKDGGCLHTPGKVPAYERDRKDVHMGGERLLRWGVSRDDGVVQGALCANVTWIRHELPWCVCVAL